MDKTIQTETRITNPVYLDSVLMAASRDLQSREQINGICNSILKSQTGTRITNPFLSGFGITNPE